jgi:hypothetical protein
MKVSAKKFVAIVRDVQDTEESASAISRKFGISEYESLKLCKALRPAAPAPAPEPPDKFVQLIEAARVRCPELVAKGFFQKQISADADIAFVYALLKNALPDGTVDFSDALQARETIAAGLVRALDCIRRQESTSTLIH